MVPEGFDRYIERLMSSIILRAPEGQRVGKKPRTRNYDSFTFPSMSLNLNNLSHAVLYEILLVFSSECVYDVITGAMGWSHFFYA